MMLRTSLGHSNVCVHYTDQTPDLCLCVTYTFWLRVYEDPLMCLRCFISVSPSLLCARKTVLVNWKTKMQPKRNSVLDTIRYVDINRQR